MIYNKHKKYCFFLLPNAHIQDYDSSSNNTYGTCTTIGLNITVNVHTCIY